MPAAQSIDQNLCINHKALSFIDAHTHVGLTHFLSVMTGEVVAPNRCHSSDVPRAPPQCFKAPSSAAANIATAKLELSCFDAGTGYGKMA